MAVLGLAFFVFMLAINSPWAWRSRQPLIPMARLASVLVGIVFVLYLVYTELFTLNAICLYCTAVHIITFLLFALVMFSAATRAARAITGAGPGPAARPRSWGHAGNRGGTTMSKSDRNRRESARERIAAQQAAARKAEARRRVLIARQHGRGPGDRASC